MTKIHSVGGQRVVPLDQGWELCPSPPGAVGTPGELEGSWLPATVPGTVAGALRDAGKLTLEDPSPLHGTDFWFRTRFRATGPQKLRFHGLATLADVWLNGEQVLSTDNMFLAHEVAVVLSGENELLICFRALGPALAGRKGRARWRPRMIEPGTLRFFRTTLLGHLPGWCPPVHAVGPWRPVERVEESGPLLVGRADARSTLDGRDAVLQLEMKAQWAGKARPDAFLEVSEQRAPLHWVDGETLRGEVRLPDAPLWWPHTHGEPVLHPIRASIGGIEVGLGRTGFRTIEVEEGGDGRGFALRVNGERVFCRGACWSSADLISLPGTRAAYEPWLLRMRDAGMNMVRVGGTMTYESDEFFTLCDELGLMVWQDFMFANFDYPASDPRFVESVTKEAEQLLVRVQSSPALAVLCGGSEVTQQAAMLGLPRSAWGSALFDELLPTVSARLRPDVPYLPNSPSGGDLPFSADSRITHYYGVGAYLRPLEDARRAEVRFASECLAFANVPETATVAKVLGAGEAVVHHPRWKARVPRDVGAPWDFEDVRDHYLGRLYGIDPARLRYEDPDRYLRMSRAVTGEVMEEVFAEWRRARSTCGGGLVWLFQDLWPGAGWGVVDALGAPKAAWHALRRAFRPVQVTITDEGVNGLTVHLLNESPGELTARLIVRCLRGGQVAVVEAEREISVPPRGSVELPLSALLDSFFDATYAYRFGPPSHDVTVAALQDGSGALLADAYHFPLGRGSSRHDLGLSARVERGARGWVLRLRTGRFAQSVHVEDDHFRAEDEWFHLPPGMEKVVALIPRDSPEALPDGEVHALNATAPIRFRASR